MTQPLPWQKDLWLDATALALQGRLGHALLLAGPAGVGKRSFARALAAFLLCEARSGYACGQCRSCQQLAVGNHPNALLLSREGLHGLAMTESGRHEQGLAHWLPKPDSAKRDIATDGVRRMIEMIALATHYQGARVVMFDPADSLNENSVNSLLKTIEEPPPGTHLLLVSERPQALKATLRSRCQRLRFSAPDEAAGLEWLQARKPQADAALLREACGAPLRALELADSDRSRSRDWAELLTGVLQLKQEPIAAAQRIGKDDAAAFLAWLLGWLTGTLKQALAGGGLLPPPELHRLMQEATDARRRLEGNANPQMLLEALLVLASRQARAQRRAT
ncbi:DNA polymerase III subunit delta' [Solimonas sp. K1W22B-7]|uniref:DNA polymerase III subunit delta' n=1 Tax=Solimonas sp. K1W22B-7 TaxID=2303331 RepID=UPI001F093198|nr:DNA polymerase III subunit delta' [Solimonas sp. K1W22B-7]